jgi:hypothetical protein
MEGLPSATRLMPKWLGRMADDWAVVSVANFSRSGVLA